MCVSRASSARTASGLSACSTSRASKSATDRAYSNRTRARSVAASSVALNVFTTILLSCSRIALGGVVIGAGAGLRVSLSSVSEERDDGQPEQGFELHG